MALPYKINQHTIRDFLLESYKEYLESYSKRLKHFENNTKSPAIDFLELELRFFNDCFSAFDNMSSTEEGIHFLDLDTLAVLIKLIHIEGIQNIRKPIFKKVNFLKDLIKIIEDDEESKSKEESLKIITFDNEYISYIEILDQKKEEIPYVDLIEETIPSKIIILENKLLGFNFKSLEKIKILNPANTNKIYKLLSENKLPYQIALLDYLGFIEYLQTDYFKTKKDLYDKLGNILDQESRSIKGNISVLNCLSKEDRDRYTAHKKQEEAKRDYEKLI